MKDKIEQCFCQSYYDDNNILQDCFCGKCAKLLDEARYAYNKYNQNEFTNWYKQILKRFGVNKYADKN